MDEKSDVAPKRVTLFLSKYLSEYLKGNFSIDDALTIKLFNAGTTAFDYVSDLKIYQITLPGAMALLDKINPESK